VITPKTASQSSDFCSRFMCWTFLPVVWWVCPPVCVLRRALP
jgi:hypothetical protein